MYSYLFGSYFYHNEMILMIDKIEQKRKLRRLQGKPITTSFAEELKNLMMGIEDTIIIDCKNCINKEDCVNCQMLVKKL